MTPAQRESALRLADELPFYGEGDDGYRVMNEAAALLRELASEPQGEPVAWWCKHPPEKGGGGFMTCDEGTAAHYMHKFRTAENAPVLVPLYAHPPQRKPLTDEQIADLVLRTVYEGDASTPHRDSWAAEIGIPFARAIEKAHGIGEAP